MKLRKIRFSLLVYWGLASVGLAMIAGIFSSTLPIFYQDYLGLRSKFIMIVSLIYALWNAFNDPLFGYVTDNTRSRWGRRIPYLRFTAPFLALTFVLVWMVPNGAAEAGVFVWMLISMILYDTCFTIIGLVQSALLPELSEYEDDRVYLQVSQAFANLLGFGLGFVITDLVRPKEGGSLFSMRMAMIAVGLIGAFLIILLSLKAKERPSLSKDQNKISFKDFISFTFKSRAALVVIASNFMRLLVQSLIIGAVFYLADYLLRLNGTLVLMFFFVPMVIGIGLTNPIKKSLGVLKTQQVYYLVGAAGLLGLFFAPVGLLPFCMALGGFGMGGPEALVFVLLSQAIDQDELRTGQRREGAFFGTNALLTKPAQSLALAIPPALLEAAKFISREDNGGVIYLDQPPAVYVAIRIFSGLIPGIAFLLAAAILLLYPIKGNDLEDEMLKRHKGQDEKDDGSPTLA